MFRFINVYPLLYFFPCCFSFLPSVYSNFIFAFGCWSFEPWFLYKYIQQLVAINDNGSCVVVEFWTLTRLTWGGSGASKINVARRNQTSFEDWRSNKTGKHSNKSLQSLDLKDSKYTCCMLYNAIMAFLVTL
jgi:hypothetical protein